ncbi:hypothetical protein QNI16_35895 [Cytophagaceae bacterium YF14B1]|uniref:Uncharacterized protein n=1 Tax=Xanthocytophaga flava TaxID=3048013 RepID=A0AAE3QZB7_9BACT|nr:hypothetical protein [Xanthocytophaga flavus]MDJ1485920.1 hypothetical protein [Xanthocytophaga flavus]
MQTHPNQTHLDQTDLSHIGSDQSNPSAEKKSTGLNIPALALLAAIKQHYLFSAESLAKLGISPRILNEHAYVRSILSQNMDSIFGILAECQSCSEYVQKVLIDQIDIDDIPHGFILESIRQRAEQLLTLEQQNKLAPYKLS